tara:strand:+ start:4977 stop:6122 length:1146 start_codon:yes stop_codon:yes gene_type:complete
MSTRYKVKPYHTQGGMETGLEGIDIPDNFEMPSCGIEDVDRAMFKLFNEDLPFYYELDGDMKRIPCIFAGGERAMILRRKKPLRDRQGALILPMVSIMRSGLDQTAEKGIGPGEGTLTIKKKLAPEDRQYKRLFNPQGLINQDGIGTRTGDTNPNLGISNKNVYEVITIPAPRFYKATYEITFWAQYLQQMNDIIEAFISSQNISSALSFKIETEKGYWFVAIVESGLSDSTNFDGYADDERVIKTSITMSVTGYLINPKFPGAPSPFRRYVSAPKVQFETTTNPIPNVTSSKLPSFGPDDYIFDDMMNTEYPLPGAAVGMVDNDGPEFSVNLGGTQRDNVQKSLKMLHPFTKESVTATLKSKNETKGEAVYIIIETLNRE